MFNKIYQWIIFCLLLLAPTILVVTYVHEFLAVDSTLDSGASYDYNTGRADFQKNHPYVPFSKRKETLIMVSLLSLLGAVSYIMANYSRRKLEKSTNNNVNDINGLA